MNESADALERLWNEAINPDPEGNWLTEFLARPDKDQHPVTGAIQVMERLAQTRVSRLDLGQVVRPQRYEMCFQTVYALEDPGVKGKLAGLHQLLPKANPNKPHGRIKEKQFFTILWEGIEGNEDFNSWMENGGEEMIFSDAVSAAKRLLEHRMTKKDIITLIRWHTYEACYQSLRVLGECFEDAEEISGLHEVLLGADPSGLEGGPNSWPLPAEAKKKSVASTQEDPTKPYLKIKGPEDFSFVADGQSFVTWGHGGPARLWDVRTGDERITFRDMKGYNCFAPAPDGSAVVASLKKSLTIFDAQTGSKTLEIPWKYPSWVTWEKPGIFVGSEDTKRAGKEHYSFYLFDPNTLAIARDLNIPNSGEFLTNLGFTLDASQFALSWHAMGGGPRLEIWSWPGVEKLAQWECFGKEWKWSPDGKFIADGDSISVRDARTGKKLHETHLGFGHMAFSPDGQWFVGGKHSSPGTIEIWNLPRWEKVKEFPIETGWCFGLEISSDGRVLGATSSRCCLFWDFPRLIKGL